MDENINLSLLFRTIKEKIPIILFFGIAGIIIGGLISFFWITPQYSSQTQMIVTTENTEEHLSDEITANLQLVKTYKELVTSDLVLGKVQEKLKTELKKDMSISQLKDAIKLTQQQDSLFFSIQAVSDRPTLSAYVANTSSQIFKESLAQSHIPGDISITTEAVPNNLPISPNHKLNLVLGLFMGLTIGILFVVLRLSFDQAIKSEQAIYEIFNINALGIIPNTTSVDMKMTTKDKELLKRTISESEDTIGVPRKQRRRV